MNPSHPAARARSRSPCMACAVTARMGIDAVAGSARIRRVASHPDRMGSDRSMRTRSGAISRALATASRPSATVKTWWLSASSTSG